VWAAFRRVVPNPRLHDLNRAAMTRGREEFRRTGAPLGPSSDADLWAV
jgi:hypothetical protein